MGTPYFDYVADREHLNEWATVKGDEKIKQYWSDKNQESIDGLATNIVKENL